MADEPLSLQPSWVGGTDNIVKMLLQGARPAPVQMPAEDEVNPWLRALAPDAPSKLPPAFPSQTDWTGAKAENLHSAPAPAKPGEPMSFPVKQLSQIPVSALVQMGQHQLHPTVEAARQRVMQALLQRPHGIIPAAPVAKA